MEDLNAIYPKYGLCLHYYENVRNLIKRKVANEFIYFDNIKLTFIKAGITTVFVFEEGKKKVIYASCDVKPLSGNDIFYNADIMVIRNTIVGDVLKDGFILKEDNLLNKSCLMLRKLEY